MLTNMRSGASKEGHKKSENTNEECQCCFVLLTIPFRISAKIEEIFHSAGLKTARQQYSYEAAGNTYKGENVYSVVRAPRGDGTEAIVLVAAWQTKEGTFNRKGVTLVMTLARYFKRMRPFPDTH